MPTKLLCSQLRLPEDQKKVGGGKFQIWEDLTNKTNGKHRCLLIVDSEKEMVLSVTPYQHQQKDNIDNLITCLLPLRLTGPMQKSID